MQWQLASVQPKDSKHLLVLHLLRPKPATPVHEDITPPELLRCHRRIGSCPPVSLCHHHRTHGRPPELLRHHLPELFCRRRRTRGRPQELQRCLEATGPMIGHLSCYVAPTRSVAGQLNCFATVAAHRASHQSCLAVAAGPMAVHTEGSRQCHRLPGRPPEPFFTPPLVAQAGI